MFQGHILIIDEYYENCRQICFLLRMSGFKVTLARTSSEGINWVTSLSEESSGFDLMLVNNVTRITDLLSLCDVFNRITGSLDVLLVERHYQPANVLADICAASCGRIGWCRSEEIMQRVRQLLEIKAIAGSRTCNGC